MLNRHHFAVGSLQCAVLRDYTSEWPMGELVSGVPEDQVVVALSNLGFSGPTVPIDSNCLLLDTPRGRVLIDAGWGNTLPGREGALLTELSAEGLSPSDIAYVVITHWDGDHIRGLLDSRQRLVFARARHIMWGGAWQHWSEVQWSATPDAREALCMDLANALKGRVELVDIGGDFLPGISLQPAPGHRPDHVALSVTSETERLLHIADAVIHPIHISRAHWCWPGHASIAQAARDKDRLLGLAARHKMLVFGSHLPFPGLGYVAPSSHGWHWNAIDPALG